MNKLITTSFAKECATVFAVAVALTCAVFALPAYANIQLDAPTTVSDDITRLHVNKLDADTHEYVSGATMVIINEETGEVVDQWVTGSGTHENEKGLDVDVVYVLRELEAPDGYSTVEDVRFVVNETEGTGITVLSQGSDSELVESYKVNLYDKADDIENEIVVTETRGVPATPAERTTKAAAPKTGDETPMMPIAMFVVAGIATILILQVPKRRMN